MLNPYILSDIIYFMISFNVKDINNFMQQLLVKETFDKFLLCECEINTSATFHINGHVNRHFYNSEELQTINNDFICWKNIKHICFEIIKGKKVPTKMKLIFALTKDKYSDIINSSAMVIKPEEIGGLYIHIIYENCKIEVITGTSLNTFTMDKTLDKYWDKTVLALFNQYFVCEEN